MADEIEIIRSVLGGDADSFRLLVQRYQRPVIRMIRNIVNDNHICEDIAQDVFLAAYRKLASFDVARSSFSTWLFTIARNRSISAIRKMRRVSLQSASDSRRSSQPTDALAQKEFFSRLDEALQRLGVRQRTAFVLAEFEGLRYEEIAQIEGARIGTIKSRINRAKKKLRLVLQDAEGEIV
ncbi:MAG: sigma-70 family RNA polymerase sigma factor [Planctomycetes bacterium]|nr:sigma-70 family RNA polymerase sigma factor [Planctomycetota bacterium]